MVQKQKKTSIILGIILLIFTACLEKMPLPSDINVTSDLFAGDTTYLRLNPIWETSLGFQSPIEISIAPDGHIFIADSAAHKIFVLEQDGSILEGFGALSNLKDNMDDDLAPIDVDIDEKMNVFFIDGSRHVYCWNQLWNDLGIDSIAVSATFTNTSIESTVTAGTIEWFMMANSREWEPLKINWTVDEEVIDSLLNPHLFFDAGTPFNESSDIYYTSYLSSFSGLSTSNSDNFIYVTDIYHNRIVQIYFVRSHLIKLGSGSEMWTHFGTFQNTVTGFGTGAGTVNIPTAIDVDFAGNIYYAQRGDFFSIHKINPSYVGGYVSYPSVFQQGQNDIMDLWRFSSPYDVAVDKKQSIYVANTYAKEIQVFNSDGSFFKKAGITKVTIDTTLKLFDGTDTVYVDTFLTIEEKGILELPSALAVDDKGVIYVCDTPNSRIVRYRLSNTLDENVTEEK